MDHKARRGSADRSKINMHQDYEVRYWTKHLGISREQLQKVVDRVGNSAAAVRKELAALAVVSSARTSAQRSGRHSAI